MSDFSNLKFRAFAGKSDYPGMASLLQQISVADDAGYWTTAEDIERDYQHLGNSNPATDMLMVENAEGVLMAYARVGWQEDGEKQQVFSFPLNIHPNLRTVEFTRFLLQWVEKRALEIIASTPASGRRILRAMLRNRDRELILTEALETQQFVAVRYMNRMRRDLAAPIEIPALPPGLEIRPVPESHYRALSNAIDEAFRDHWGYAPISEENYQGWLTSPSFKPSLWQVAWEGDEIAAGILNFVDEDANQQFNVQRGWTDPIFTRRPWRKRGLARALLMRSLQMFKDMGMTEAMLGVDTQNPSGAFKLYESCGFESVLFSVIYEKALAE